MAMPGTPLDELILFGGMSIGYEGVTEGYVRRRGMPLEETVTFVEG